mmetsp:Transcript_20481/g.30187  ORF Transcript_20481/g.30187 Transcript_20481/m.30187 type:complete len:108 (+) Transcript_20481:71-394(+)
MSNAGNPITSWIRGGMETYSVRESGMKDRVAETSINAQKICDEKRGPFKAYNNAAFTHKGKDFSHFYIANSSFKGKEEGCVNSFKSLRYYQDESKNYREELLKEVSA